MSLVSAKYCLRFSDALLKHIKLKHNAKILSMLEGTNSYQLTDSSETSLLHHAAKYGNYEFARHLIDLGAEIDAQNRTEETPLMLAVDNDCEATVRLLVEANADMFKPDFSGQCALGKAFKNRQNISENVMTALLDGVSVESLNRSAYAKDQLFHVSCPLYYFMSLKNTEVTRFLLENGSSVNAKKPYTGETALHAAVANFDVENVKLLLEYKADVNAKSSDGKTPLACIPRFDENNSSVVLEILELLMAAAAETINYDDGVILVESLLIYGSAEVVRKVLQCEIDLDFCDRNDRTVLLFLADNEHLNIFEELRDINVNIDCYSLHSALVGSKVRFVQFLLERGVKFNARDINPFRILSQLDYIVINVDNIDFRQGMIGCIESVLAHLALIVMSGRQIDENMRSQIESQTCSKNMFDSKRLQLEKMKHVKVGNSVTLLDILTVDDDHKISMYASNKRLISNIVDAMKGRDIDSYYHYRLRIRFAKIKQLIEKRENLTNIIHKALSGLFNLSLHIVAEKLVNYLDDRDLNKLMP